MKIIVTGIAVSLAFATGFVANAYLASVPSARAAVGGEYVPYVEECGSEGNG